MREIRHTFEHLVVILGVFFLCLIILFAIPGVRLWFFEQVPAAAVSIAGTEAVGQLVTGVNPKLLADAVNDDDTRADLIELWGDAIPEMDTEAVAEIVNEVLADPNIAALVADVTAELNEKSLADLVNVLLADPATSDFVIDLLPYLDQEGLSTMLNEILASEPAMSLTKSLIHNTDAVALGNLINELLADNSQSLLGLTTNLMDNIEADVLGNFVNGLLADDTQVLSNFTTDLIREIDTEKAADLVNEITQNEVMITQLDGLVGGLDPTVLSDLLFELLVQPDVQNFTEELLGTIEPGTALADLLNDPEGGLRHGLFGNPNADDAFMDWFWLEIRNERWATNGGLSITQHLSEHTLAPLKPVLDAVGLLAGYPDLYLDLAELIGAETENLFGGKIYLRFPDFFFGTEEEFAQHYEELYPEYYE